MKLGFLSITTLDSLTEMPIISLLVEAQEYGVAT